MTKEELINEASKLPRPTSEAATEYAAKSEALAGELNQIMGARDDLEALIGPGNKAMMEDNHRNHARFITSLLTSYQPEVLVNTVLWVFRAYRAHGFGLTYWPAQLDTWITLLRRELSPAAFESIHPLYLFMLIHQPDFVELTEQPQSGEPR